MKTPPIDRASIAKAMKAAAVMAKTGSREEKSGRFIAPKAASRPGKAA